MDRVVGHTGFPQAKRPEAVRFGHLFLSSVPDATCLPVPESVLVHVPPQGTPDAVPWLLERHADPPSLLLTFEADAAMT